MVVDPSHGTGKASLIKSMTMAAIAAGTDALILEVHPNPEKALSDGAQTISTEAFCQLMKEAKVLASALGKLSAKGTQGGPWATPVESREMWSKLCLLLANLSPSESIPLRMNPLGDGFARQGVTPILVDILQTHHYK